MYQAKAKLIIKNYLETKTFEYNENIPDLE